MIIKIKNETNFMLSKPMISLAVSAAYASANECPFGFSSDEKSSALNVTKKGSHPRVRSDASYPSDIFTCSANTSGYGVATTSASVDITTYESIVADVITAYELVDDTVEDNNIPRAKFAGCMVRTAGHDFMDYRVAADGSSTGGSDGCMYFADGDNTGLADCLEDSGLADVY